MSDLNISCPECDQSLEIPEEMLGQIVDCPSCQSQIQLPPPPQPSSAKKETQDCPFCGEEILLKAKKCKHCGEFLDGTPQTPQKKKDAGPEKTIWKGNPSGLYYIKNWVVGPLFIIVGLGLAASNPIFLWLSAIGLWGIIYGVLDRKTKLFTLTNQRAVSHTGIIAKKTNEVAVRDIRSVAMIQSILERIFGLGTVQIGSAGTGGIEVQFKGICNPAKVRDLIRKTKDDIDG